MTYDEIQEYQNLIEYIARGYSRSYRRQLNLEVEELVQEAYVALLPLPSLPEDKRKEKWQVTNAVRHAFSSFAKAEARARGFDIYTREDISRLLHNYKSAIGKVVRGSSVFIDEQILSNVEEIESVQERLIPYFEVYFALERLREINEKHYHVLKSYYIEGYSLEEIGGSLGGISHQAVKQIRERALRKISELLN